MTLCPLCGVDRTAFYHRDKKRAYCRCLRCDLVFVPASYHLSEMDEKAEYDLHQNDSGDEGYRNFLRRLAQPLTARLSEPSYGLDFGCGPGPALHHLLKDAGHEVRLYDKFYVPDEQALQDHYDFIAATEVVEHLSQPGDVLSLLWRQLLPGGLLALMTKRVVSAEAFASWHYKNDPTHIAFFSDATFRWLANGWRADVEFTGPDVVIFRKPAER